MVSRGQSASGLVQSQFEQRGIEVISRDPRSRRRGGSHPGSTTTLKPATPTRSALECPRSWHRTPMVRVRQRCIPSRGSIFSPRAITSGVPSPDGRNWPAQRGTFLFPPRSGFVAKVGLSDRRSLRRLFQTTTPLGESSRIKNIPFRVIGVLERRGPIASDGPDNVHPHALYCRPQTAAVAEFDTVRFDPVSSARSLAVAPDARPTD